MAKPGAQDRPLCKPLPRRHCDALHVTAGLCTSLWASPRLQTDSHDHSLSLVASRANPPKTAFVALPLIVALPELPEFDKRRPGRRRLGAGPAVVVLVPSRAPAPARLAAVQVQGDCDLTFVTEINLKLF